MKTYFRAFQLDSEGSLFSFYKQNHYTLIEARLPKGGHRVIQADLAQFGKNTIDTNHITSWDIDHCNSTDLFQIINHYRPSIIEVPPYDPDSDEGRMCKRVIYKYDDIHQQYVHNVREISQSYIRGLKEAPLLGTNDVLYESLYGNANKNDKSLIRFYRSAGFNVLSLGDCESCAIAEYLLTCPLIRNEVDVLILPHHGADNGFITGPFLDILRPKIAICSSNTGNQYDHPRQEIRNLLRARNIELCTTKRGDVIVKQDDESQIAQVLSFQEDNNGLEKTTVFRPKRYQTVPQP